jgi:hypothetical protein
MMKTFAHYFDGPAPGGCEDALPIILREEKCPDRRKEALARASAATFKPRVRPRIVGHHPNNPPRPKRFYVQLDKNDLYMLIIPKEFKLTSKGAPIPS